MEISLEKSKLITRKKGINLVINIMNLETVLANKYLGVQVEIDTRPYCDEFSKKCAAKSEMHKNTTISLASTSPNKILFATRIWTTQALPSILYGSDFMVVPKLAKLKQN